GELGRVNNPFRLIPKIDHHAPFADSHHDATNYLALLQRGLFLLKLIEQLTEVNVAAGPRLIVVVIIGGYHWRCIIPGRWRLRCGLRALRLVRNGVIVGWFLVDLLLFFNSHADSCNTPGKFTSLSSYSRIPLAIEISHIRRAKK